MATQCEIQIRSYKVFPTESNVQTIIRKWSPRDTLEKTWLLFCCFVWWLLLCRNDIQLPFLSYLSFMNMKKSAALTLEDISEGELRVGSRTLWSLSEFVNYTGRCFLLVFVKQILEHYFCNLILNQVMSSLRRCWLISSL